MRRIVLLPGLDGTGTLLENFIQAAPPELQLLPIRFPREALSYADLAEHLAPKLRLDADTFLLAESFSGPLAILLAARHRVAGLVLCNSFVVAPRPTLWSMFARSIVFRIPPPAALVRRYLVGSAASDALVEQVRAAVAELSPATAAFRMRLVLHVDVIEDLRRSRMPILYLRGTEDRLVRNVSVDTLAAVASDRVAVAQIRGPHLLLQATPDAAWRAIREFILPAPAV
jgi:pimeloyl-[acyl-carrier protein] methyl ester esterase